VTIFKKDNPLASHTQNIPTLIIKFGDRFGVICSSEFFIQTFHITLQL